MQAIRPLVTACAAVAILFLCAGPATAGMLRHSRLAVMPSSDLMSNYYPDRALLAEMSGRAIVRCTALATGRLTTCHTISEVPAGMGFGRAASLIAPLMRTVPASLNGAPVADNFTMSFNFVLPEDARGRVVMKWFGIAALMGLGLFASVWAVRRGLRFNDLASPAAEKG